MVLLLTLLCTIGGTTLATIFVTRHVHRWAELVSTVGMTLVLFIFAEVTPKTFTVQHTDRVALRLAPIIVAMTTAVGPVARLLVKVANVLMPGRGLPQGPFATEEEIRAMAEVASEEDTIEEEEKELIHSIFEFGDTVVREVMVPRPDMVTAPVSARMQEVLDLILRHGYSRIPVYKENVDDIVGVAYAKDLLRHLHAGKARHAARQHRARAVLRPGVEEGLGPDARDAAARRPHRHRPGRVRIDRGAGHHRGPAGGDRRRDRRRIRPRGARDRARGREPLPGERPHSIDDINELLEVELPQDEWDTVAGLMYALLGAVATQGETVRFGDLEFTAERVQGRRIATVLIARRPAEQSTAPARDSSEAAAGAE